MSCTVRGVKLDAIIGFLSGLVDLFVGIVDFVIGLIGDLAYLAQITGKAVAAIPSYFSWVPPQVLALLLSIFTVVVLYKILGREG